MATKVSELVGNSFRLKKNVTAYDGRPLSDKKRTWKSGQLTPVVYSWVKRNGQVWWQFGRQEPIQFIKHDPAALEPVAERGAAEHLSAELGGDKGKESAGVLGGFTFPNITAGDILTPFKILAYLIAFYIGYKIYDLTK